MNTKQFFSIGILTSLAIASAACSDSSSSPSSKKTSTSGGSTSGTTNTGSSSSGTTTGTSTDTTSGGSVGGSTGMPSANPLTFDATGWVDMTQTGTFGIQGAWYAYADSLGPSGQPPGDCQNDGFTTDQCSSMDPPVFNADTQTICVTGNAAAVIQDSTGMPAYSAIWGAGLGFDLNNSGGDAAVKSPYDAQSHNVTGVGFTIDQLPAGAELRVEFPTPAMETTAHYVIVDSTGPFEARFSDAALYYQKPPDTSAIDTKQVFSFQWHVATSTSGAVPFQFCLSDIHVLTN